LTLYGVVHEEASYVDFEDVNFCCKTFCPKNLGTFYCIVFYVELLE